MFGNSNSPYKLIFYILIPYFVLLILYQLYSTPKTTKETFESGDSKSTVGVSTQPSPKPTKTVTPVADTRAGDLADAKTAIGKKSKPESKFLSPLDDNYKQNMAEQDRIKKQIKEIDEKRKKLFLTEYQEATKTELEMEKLHKQIKELQGKLDECKKRKELSAEKSESSEAPPEIVKSKTPKKEITDSFDSTMDSSNDSTTDSDIANKTNLLNSGAKTVVGCDKDSECNLFYGDGKNTCKSNKQCRCEVGSGVLCQYGPTNYKDTKDMTTKERTIFKNLSNYDNFTIQDYKNWLSLYKKDYYLLSDDHLINLRKVLRGEPLALRDIPTGGLRPPLTSQKYFAEMYDKLTDLEQIVSPINSSTTGVQVGYNYSDYSDFSPPTSIPQLRVVNGEVERKYRRPSAINKIFPVPLEDAIGPYKSNPAM
jgi:hypothetical protein